MTPRGDRWVAVVPVKLLPVAKTRLALPTTARADLALAMACDVVLACLTSSLVVATVVVTNDDRAAEVLIAIGATVIPDSADAGLNPALVDGARHAARHYPETGVLAASSDLPALTGRVLDHILTAAAHHERAVLADAEGTGTTLLAARRGLDLGPDFGAGSRDRHVARGATELDGEQWPEAQRDVDTLADLAVAATLGLGPHTGAAATRLGLLDAR